jgi:hypothetical protein
MLAIEDKIHGPGKLNRSLREVAFQDFRHLFAKSFWFSRHPGH